MIFYLLNIFGLTLANFIHIKGSSENAEIARKRLVCVVGTVNWILLSGLRGHSVGADTESYKIWFDNLKNVSWDSIVESFHAYYFENSVADKDPGFSVLVKLFQLFSNDYQMFLMFIAVLFTVPMGIWIYKYSNSVYISFLIYSTLFYSFFAITGIRQTIATALAVFLGIEFIKRKKLVLFLLVLLLTSTIHKSALCVIPFYWLSQIKNRKLTIWSWWIFIICSYIFRYRLLSILQSIVGYESYTDYYGAGAGTFVFLLLAITMICTVFYDTIKKNAGELFGPSINAVYIACFFSSLLLINQSMMRVVQYYSVYLMLLIPETEKIFTIKSRKLYQIICVSMLILLLIKNQPYYCFFWE